MNPFKKLGSLFSSKESQARIVASFNQVGKPVYTPANYTGFAHNGYAKNTVVYSAISKITIACSGINWVLYQKRSRSRKKWKELEEHPLLTLWDKPNPLQATASFIESLIGFYKITGNMYIEANTTSTAMKKPPMELWPVRPDKMTVIPNNMGYVGKYKFSSAGISRTWQVDAVTLRSAIMHLKTFNPVNDWYGLSPLEAALLSVDQNNAGQRWNLGLLQNSATPSGVLQMKVTDANPRGELTDEQYGRLRKEFEDSYVGARNAGRPLIIEGGLNWQAISMSPKDMDFLNNKKTTAEDIALAYGVPPELLGLGTKTFANYKEARQAFYEETVLPTMDAFRDHLNMWLVPAYGDGLYFDYDKDDIEALVEKREAKYTSLQAVNFLSINEKREAAGYDTKEGLDLYNLNGVLYTEDELANIGLTPDDLNTDQESDNPEPPPSKPPQDEDENEDDDEVDSGDEDTEDENGKSKELAFKSINLLNANERRKSWQKQNKIRAYLSKGFDSDLKSDYKELISRLTKTADDLERAEPQVIRFALIKDVDEWSPKLTKTMSNHIEKTLRLFGDTIIDNAKEQGIAIETKQNLKYNSFIIEYISKRTGENIKTIMNTSQKQIKKIVGEWVAESITAGDSIPTLSSFLEKEFEGLSRSNSERIARTEVQLASNNGSREAVKSLQVPTMYKRWVSASDSRVRDGYKGGADHLHIDEENGEIPIDDYFKVNPDVLMEGPGDTSAPADQVINCRCVLTYKNKGE